MYAEKSPNHDTKLSILATEILVDCHKNIFLSRKCCLLYTPTREKYGMVQF